MSLYQQLATEIEQQIDAGAFPPGSKLPSVRGFATTRGISPTTVAGIYELLRTRGRVETRARSGYFVLPVHTETLTLPARRPALLPSASIAVEDLLHDVLSAGNDDSIFPFGAAIPRPAFYPVAAVNRMLLATLRENPALLAAYRFVPGSENLRKTLARRYQRMGVKVAADAVVTTCGAIEGIGLALGAIAAPGATVGIEAPTYAGIFQLARGLGYKVLEIPLDATRGLTPDALEAALRKARGNLQAVVTIPNFSNPLGTRVSDTDKAALAALASREGIVLIEDDIYGDLAFARERPKPLKAFDRDDSVILCTSFSKTISPALRVGAVLNAKHAARIAALKYARGTGTSAFAEEVLHRFLEQGIYERHLGKVRGEYRTLIARYTQQILQTFPVGTRVSQPEGGYLLWVELPHAIDGRLIQKHALTRRISVAPGSIFSDGGEHYRNYIRLNCAIPWSEAARKALVQLARLVAGSGKAG